MVDNTPKPPAAACCLRRCLIFGYATLLIPVVAAVFVPGPIWMRVIYYVVTFAVLFELMAMIAHPHLAIHATPKERASRRAERALWFLDCVVQIRAAYRDLLKVASGK